MSSPEEDNLDDSTGALTAKKRRVQRACDICRRKKVRCDGGSMPGNRCSNCITYNFECTYVEAAKKRGPPKGYVESLENRLQKMETLLHKLCPDADFSQELGPPFERDTWYSDRGERSSTNRPGTSAPSSLPPVLANNEVDSLEPSDDEITAQQSLAKALERVQLNPAAMRFFGKSSSVMFIQTAIEAKHEYEGVEMPKKSFESKITYLPSKRPQFWGVHPWIQPTLYNADPHKDFPPEDLMLSLIDLYFDRVNSYLPLLHRPTFEKTVAENLHRTEEGFGSIVLLVCAVGSRFSDDPRVVLEGSDSSHSCGYQWFEQVQFVRQSLMAAPRLYDLQICVLTAVFLSGTSAPQACWTVIGVGIRLAQDVGAHRRKVYSSEQTIDEELWKRAFWVLVCLDRAMSMALGRPCAIQDEDFDVELPSECDDEYWIVNGKSTFKQPPGKPSSISYFICHIQLNQILAFALRTIYSINKSKVLLGFVGQQWEQHIVAELDSALNKWIDSVPDHLRWDPNNENALFLNQAALLYSHYYQLQIAVHRPFIPSPRKPSPLSFPSLAICTNAARSCTHVLDTQFQKLGYVLHFNQMGAFTSGIVLLLNIWGGKKSGLNIDPVKEMADVHKCMKQLKYLEPKWHTAGRLWDVLRELASVGDLPLPQPSPAPSQKRERDSDNPIYSPGSIPASTPSDAPSPASSSSTHLPITDNTRVYASNRRVARDPYAMQQQQQQQQSHLQTYHRMSTSQAQASPSTSHQSYSPQPPSANPTNACSSSLSDANNNTFSLPIYTQELGSLPLHPGFSNSAPSSGWTTTPTSTNTGGSMHMQSAGAGVGTGMDPTGMSSMFDMSQVYGQVLSGMSNPGGYSMAGMDGSGVMNSMMAGSSGGGGGGNVGMGGAGGAGGQGGGFTDRDTLDMWSNAPQGFEWDDWGTYITNVTGGMPPNDQHNPHGRG